LRDGERQSAEAYAQLANAIAFRAAALETLAFVCGFATIRRAIFLQ
jgi:hypothetical protein